jgi:hypothetical protein
MRSAILMLSLALMGCNDGGGSDTQPVPTSRTSDTPGTAPIQATEPAPIEPEPVRVVYLVGASFETCPLSWACDGPRTSQHLGALLATRGDVLVCDGRPGEYHADQYAAVLQWLEFRAGIGVEHERADVAILGLANDALRDAPLQSLDSLETAAAIVEDLFALAETVIAIEYPMMSGRDLPGLTDGMHIDALWWDQTFRPAYRERMKEAGAIVLDAYAGWLPTMRERPGSPYPDYHLTSDSAKRAAGNIYSVLAGAWQ